MRALVLLAAAATIACGAARAEPSFDCSKAQTAAEREVCRVPALQWFDRQLARLYMQAKQAGANVLESQRAFLAARERCGKDEECLERAYGRRLKELGALTGVTDGAAEFEPQKFGGSMWVVRYGDVGAIAILTVGDNGHTCVFETDAAVQTGRGVLKWQGKIYEGDDQTCRLNVIPNGDDLDVETKGTCQSACGMRAIMDGFYKRRN